MSKRLKVGDITLTFGIARLNNIISSNEVDDNSDVSATYLFFKSEPITETDTTM